MTKRTAVLILAVLLSCSSPSPSSTDGGSTKSPPGTPPAKTCPATSTGFSSHSGQWALPFPLIRSNGADDDSLANLAHATMDLDGDGLPDFVVSKDSERSEADALVGKSYWLVFKNTGSGFDTHPVQWSLPYPLINESGADNDQLANTAHLLMDLDGDGKADFVVIHDTERTTSDPLVGKAYWLVFKNTGSGFSTSPTEWGLPFALISHTGENNNQVANQHHVVMDLDGDNKPDFVELDDQEEATPDPLAGKAYWLVFKNTGSGFSTSATQWGLPFALISHTGDNNNQASNLHHVILELDGDYKPDFVELDDQEEDTPDPLAGKAYWLVFKNTGSGFSTSATQWGLPFALLSNTGDNNNQVSNASHAVIDLDGDGKSDFLVYKDQERANPDPLVGKSYWLVFKNTGSGFDTSSTQWALPFPLLTSTGADYDVLTNTAHALVSFKARAPDFMVVEDEERANPDPLVGKSYWVRFANACSP